jgi:hypothetical protein
MIVELEKYYASSLNLVWKQIDVEDMRRAAKESKKADSKG